MAMHAPAPMSIETGPTCLERSCWTDKSGAEWIVEGTRVEV